MSKMLYTILFPFMSEVLKLEGYAKETFAVIFNFWRIEQKPVVAPISVIQKITGGSRPAIVAAIQYLLDKSLISAEKHKGKATLYSVTINEQILSSFQREYAELLVTRRNQQRLGKKTSTSSLTEPQIENISNSKNNMSLRVRKDVSVGALREI